MRQKVIAVIERINTLIIFVAGLIGLGCLGLIVFMLVNETMASNARTTVVVDETGQEYRAFKLGSLDDLDGTPYVMAELYSRGRGGGSFSSSSYVRDTWNYLFYDAETRQARWLIDHNKTLFTTQWSIGRTDGEKNSRRVIGLLFSIVTEDTDDDGQLTDDDRAHIAWAEPSGKGFTSLITDVDEFLGRREVDERIEVLLYTLGRDILAAEVDMVAGTITSTTTVGAVPEAVKLSG